MSEQSKNAQDAAYQLVCQIISEEADVLPEELSPSTLLVKDLDLDTNSIMQILIACQVEFDVDMDTYTIRDFQTVNDVVSWVLAVDDYEEAAYFDE